MYNLIIIKPMSFGGLTQDLAVLPGENSVTSTRQALCSTVFCKVSPVEKRLFHIIMCVCICVSVCVWCVGLCVFLWVSVCMSVCIT